MPFLVPHFLINPSFNLLSNALVTPLICLSLNLVLLSWVQLIEATSVKSLKCGTALCLNNCIKNVYIINNLHMIVNMKRSYTFLSSDSSSDSGSSSSVSSSKDRFVRMAKHKEGFCEDWKVQYPWLLPVHD